MVPSSERRFFEQIKMRSTGEILNKIRAAMKNLSYVNEPLHAYIITSSDPHSNEYLADCDKRRDYVSGFTGSVGTAIITETAACLWTDGRYYIQADKELDAKHWTLMKEGSPSTPSQEVWLSQNLPVGSKIGVDPTLIQNNSWLTLKNYLDLSGHHLVSVTVNLVDKIWEKKPTLPSSPIFTFPVSYSGKWSKVKVEEVRTKMKEKKVTALVVTALDEIAWLLNLRGSDITYNPVFFSYVILTLDELHLFIDESKITASIKDHFTEEGVTVIIHPYESFGDFLTDLVPKGKHKFWLSNTTNYGIHSKIPSQQKWTSPSPIALLKSVKNETEIKGLIDCHIRDGAALCRYFSWLERNLGKMEITEVSGAEKLEEFRKKLVDYLGPSFSTISSAGPNAAITHYSPTKGSDRAITTEEIYLCDSGAQFRDGTTDVTRTLHFGTPKQFEKECFTRVLKGQIQLGTCKFPSEIKGNYLDAFARKFLWDVGLDYFHGTSHGIGHCLNVHEYPVGITWRQLPDDPGLSEGMFLSNEPGYYQDDDFGIRLENIVRIVPAKSKYSLKNRSFLTFETVTMVPIQTKMMEPSLLTDEEVKYINNYHSEVREKVEPLLKEMGDREALEWLYKETQPIG